MIGSGAATPLRVVNFSIRGSLPVPRNTGPSPASQRSAPSPEMRERGDPARRDGWVRVSALYMLLQSAQLADVGQVAGDGGGGGHRRTHEVGLGVLALAAFEIAVRGRGDPLTVHRLVGVHRH